jgi:branched-chain amino acid transport system permease protein
MTTTIQPQTSPAPKRAPFSIPGSTVRRHYAVLAAVVIVLAFVPFILPESAMPVAIRTLIFAIMAIGWNLMSGYGGMFSFGHAIFFGVGAYTDAYLLTAFGISPWISMIIGAALAAGIGVLIAFLCLKYRLGGSYFSLATFAFAQMFLLVTLNLDFLNKSEGINIPLLPQQSWSMLQFDQGSFNYYWIPLAMVGVAIAITISYVHSRSGQFTQAIRDDWIAAESLGITVMRYRLVPVAISCAITSVAGAYYVQYYLFIGPDQAFGLTVSTNAIVPAVIGGLGTIWGPLIGALVVGPLSDLVAGFVRNPPPFLDFLQGTNGLDIAIYAILLILIVIFLPKGIYGTIRNRRRK